MNIVIPQDVVDSQLAECADGETGDFTIKGATFHLVPGVGAVLSGETITKAGYEGEPGIVPDAAAPMPKGKTSPAAMAVIGRKGGY